MSCTYFHILSSAIINALPIILFLVFTDNFSNLISLCLLSFMLNPAICDNQLYSIAFIINNYYMANIVILSEFFYRWRCFNSFYNNELGNRNLMRTTIFKDMKYNRLCVCKSRN